MKRAALMVLRADPKDALLTRGKGGIGPWGARAS